MYITKITCTTCIPLVHVMYNQMYMYYVCTCLYTGYSQVTLMSTHYHNYTCIIIMCQHIFSYTHYHTCICVHVLYTYMYIFSKPFASMLGT